ncbi:MAG TPA: YtxH domain-containing protein [Candidatus Saccharimonadales bacterium]|nr:YtxH domain-containing protein [Candidatus Saccharimonadales bacterium]
MMTRRQRQKNMRRLAIGSAIAGAIGYLAGLLTAPQSGKETRQDIKDSANKAQAEAEKELKKLHTELDKSLSQAKVSGDKLRGRAKDELNDLTDKAGDSKEKVREMLSAVHEGEADDKDLERAIKEANRALDHLRKYLKK